MRNENMIEPQKPQCVQAVVMVRFLDEFPNGSFQDYKKYYENYINEKFEEYKQKQFKILKKDLK